MHILKTFPAVSIFSRALAAGAALLACGALWADGSGAEAALAEGRFQDAKELAAARVAAEGESAEALCQLGRAASGLGEHAEAERLLKSAIALDGSVGQYHAYLGDAKIARAQTLDMMSAGAVYMSALDSYKRAVALDPDNLHAHIALCRYYWNAPAMGGGSMAKAKEHAGHVARINPYQGKIEHAYIASREGDAEAAAGFFAEAAAMHPGSVEARFELGKLRQAAGLADEARAAFEEVLRIDPQHAGAAAALEAL